MNTESIFYFVDTFIHVINLFCSFTLAVKFNMFFFVILSAFSEYKLGLIAHEGCHGSISRYYGIMYDFVFSSSEMWIDKHNKKHHIYTNKKKDPDIDITPFLRIRQNQPLYWYHKYQHIYQYFLFTLGALSLRIHGLYHIYLRNCYKTYFIHFFLNLPSLLLFIIYPIYKWKAYGLLYYLLHNILIGLFYGIIFSVSHVNEKVLFDDNETKFEIIQLNETADWSKGSIFWNYMTNGLNHQVIHHLKPHISSFNYPLLSYKLSNSKIYKGKYKSFKNLFYAINSNYNYMKKLGQYK